MAVSPTRNVLQRYFAGITEHAFMEHLGIGDAPLTDYLAEMLTRFVHMDRLYVLHDVDGEKLTEVANMLIEAEGLPPESRTRREVFRHIGDYTLFWTGVYPEALRRLKHSSRMDHFIDYCSQGKRSYAIASHTEDDHEDPVLKRLSDNFELCAFGLNHVRKEFGHSGLAIDEEGNVRRVIH
ncbi:MAG TPA: hypothetical protein PKA06_09155 [Gemmatales bacterium]|nr:hypothetical protein [Gemmatales bacterium]